MNGLIKFRDAGHSENKPGANIIRAFKDGSALPYGVFYGYYDHRKEVFKLYPADMTTRSRFSDLRELPIREIGK